MVLSFFLSSSLVLPSPSTLPKIRNKWDKKEGKCHYCKIVKGTTRKIDANHKTLCRDTFRWKATKEECKRKAVTLAEGEWKEKIQATDNNDTEMEKEELMNWTEKMTGPYDNKRRIKGLTGEEQRRMNQLEEKGGNQRQKQHSRVWKAARGREAPLSFKQ